MPVVVAFLSQKGGVGKSTLARALATLATESGVRVLVADLDVQQNTVLRWQELRTSRALSPAITVRAFASIDEALQNADDYQLVIADASGRASRATLDIAQHAHLVVQPTGPGLDDLHLLDAEPHEDRELDPLVNRYVFGDVGGYAGVFERFAPMRVPEARAERDHQFECTSDAKNHG